MKRPGGVRLPGCWIVALVAAALFGGLFFATHERVTEEVKTGYQGRARFDPFLALSRFLPEFGIPVEELAEGLTKLPPEGQVLLLFAPREAFSDRQAESLLSWVARGGILLVAPRVDDEDPLLSRLAISRRSLKPTRPGPEEAGKSEPADPPSLTLDVWGEDIAVMTRTPHRLVAGRRDWDVAAPSNEAALLVSFPHGKGRISVIADPWIFANSRIGKAGHARLLLRLVSGPVDAEADEDLPHRTAWLVRRDSLPSFLTWVNRKAGPALWGLLALAAAGLLHAGRRFGAIRGVPPPARRSVLEHIDAVGEYLYRKGLAPVLVKATREALLKRLAVIEPGTLAGGRRECVRRLSELSRFSPARVDQALHGELPRKPEELAGLIRTLEILRRCL